MLKVSYSDTDGERWTLCGRLAGQWVNELCSLWRRIREQTPHARAVVDLTDVIFIDESGARLLADMETSGAEFIAAGVENKHLIAGLNNRSDDCLRRGLEDLSDSKAAGSLSPRSAQAAEGGTKGKRNSTDLAARSESVVREFLRGGKRK